MNRLESVVKWHSMVTVVAWLHRRVCSPSFCCDKNSEILVWFGLFLMQIYRKYNQYRNGRIESAPMSRSAAYLLLCFVHVYVYVRDGLVVLLLIIK